MKPITIKTPVQIDIDELTAATTLTDLGSIFSHIANSMSVPANPMERRVMAGKIAEDLSENGTRLLGEVVALAYHNAQRDNPAALVDRAFAAVTP